MPKRRRKWPLRLLIAIGVAALFISSVQAPTIRRGRREHYAIAELLRIPGCTVDTFNDGGTPFQRRLLPQAIFDRANSVHLENTAVTDAQLAPLGRLRAPWEIWLNHTPIDGSGLACLVGTPGPQHLKLAQTRLTDAAMANLRDLPNMIELDVSDTAVSDDGLARLDGCRAVQTLDLDNTRVTDAGLVHLASMPNLQTLYLNGDSGVTDAGMTKLAALTHLQVLWLQQTGVTDAGIDKLKSLSGLKELYVEDTPVTIHGKAALQAAIPGLRIYGVRRQDPD